MGNGEIREVLFDRSTNKILLMSFMVKLNKQKLQYQYYALNPHKLPVWSWIDRKFHISNLLFSLVLAQGDDLCVYGWWYSRCRISGSCALESSRGSLTVSGLTCLTVMAKRGPQFACIRSTECYIGRRVRFLLWWSLRISIGLTHLVILLYVFTVHDNRVTVIHYYSNDIRSIRSEAKTRLLENLLS